MVLFLCANILSAQWVNMSIPEDCFEVNILYKTESGRIYAATNTGIYLSTDFGSRWNYISQDLKNDGTVTCIAGNDSLLFAGVYTNGLYKTSNNGINWTKVLYDNNQYLIPNSILIKDNEITVSFRDNAKKCQASTEATKEFGLMDLKEGESCYLSQPLGLGGSSGLIWKEPGEYKISNNP